jgi:hypothetical protein
MRRRAACAAAAMACLLSARAWADPTDEEKAVADLRFREGRELLADKKVDLACAKFAESARLFPRAGVLLNLASCHETQGKFASAWTEYALANSAAHKEGRADREEIAQKKIAALKDELSWLTINVPAGSEGGLVVRRDGVEVGRGAFGVAIPVDAGEHVIVFESPDTPRGELRVTVGAHGDRRTVLIPARPPLPPVPAPPLEAPLPFAAAPRGPLVPGPGVARLHIEASEPGVALYTYTASDPTLGYAEPRKDIVCFAPCDRLVDGRAENLYFAGPSLPGTDVFSFEGRQGDVRATVRAGSIVPLRLGLVAILVGIAGGVTGTSMAIVGAAKGPTGEGSRNIGFAVLGASAATFVLGYLLTLKYRTTYKLDPPTGR